MADPDNTVQLNAALSNPKEDIAYLDRLEERLFAFRYALDEVMTFGPVIDPPKASEERAEAMALLDRERHELLCAPETGAVLKRLETNLALLDDVRAAQVRILLRDRAALVDVPTEEAQAMMRLTTEANEVWRKAKVAGDWESFEPYLDRLVETYRRVAGYKNPAADPYDVWLDDFEHGTDRAFYDAFFSEVKETVVPLLADVVASRRQPSLAVIEGSFDEERQWRLADDLMKLEGVDTDALWIGKTEHPCTAGPGVGYVVIASHVHKDSVISNVFSMLHEGGHCLYEQGCDPTYRFTSLKGGTSSGMHEAQSRFFENYVGRSRAFAKPLLECMRKHFPGQLGRATANQLYLAENRAEPSLIRTEADELTYPLHILVRYEIEQLLFSGEATAADVPGLWEEKMREYLGVRVPNHTVGALQDTHWSDGLFGYFPTYAYGSAIGAQLKSAMVRGGVDFDGACAAGDLAPIRAWLADNIWRHGRTKDSPELIQDACGEPFSAKYFTDYLTEKFSAIYGLGA